MSSEGAGRQPVAGDRVERRSGRVLVLDGTGRVLLLQGHDASAPEAGSWWFTPGGGLEPGETPVQAAARELWEETGLRDLPLAGPVAEREAEFTFEGVDYRQHEQFFVVRVGGTDLVVAPAAHTELEVRSMLGWRWWSAAELSATTDTVHPEWLAGWLAGQAPAG
ncbi:NUDIX hydrolase [Aquipuribacter sp. SD81]|uniref:NUDIX hydrolase n=1 Tax=Aquipuribacter sp. SD81 TaxID=3127703 RepID=UPI00301A6F21